MTPREELYNQLGLPMIELPDYSCGGCPACKGLPFERPGSYSEAELVAEDRLRAIEFEREERMAKVRLAAERSKLKRGPVLAWTSEAK